MNIHIYAVKLTFKAINKSDLLLLLIIYSFIIDISIGQIYCEILVLDGIGYLPYRWIPSLDLLRALNVIIVRTVPNNGNFFILFQLFVWRSLSLSDNV